ncbi:MAG: hypothetical protein RSD35_07965 [Oscillospiraceae bacterium]
MEIPNNDRFKDFIKVIGGFIPVEKEEEPNKQHYRYLVGEDGGYFEEINKEQRGAEEQ